MKRSTKSQISWSKESHGSRKVPMEVDATGIGSRPRHGERPTHLGSDRQRNLKGERYR